jgi:hypothetical protein
MNGRKWRNLERPVADPRRRIAAIGRARTEAAGVDQLRSMPSTPVIVRLYKKRSIVLA